MIELRPYQRKAVEKMKNGCILCGGVGSGKSRTALSYYYIQNGGNIDTDCLMKNPKDLYIITTARKRDTLEWEEEMLPFRLTTHNESKLYSNNIAIDSWNNIKKYKEITDSFFIFDEQRVVGHGEWVKSFLKIAKNNQWILLSATPGDTWSDYIPVFIANGFYKNFTQFRSEHIVYRRAVKYPVVDRYLNTGKLLRLRRNILINMDYRREVEKIHAKVMCSYNREEYKKIIKTRWNSEKEMPIRNASEFCYILRKLINTDPSRIDQVLEITKEHPKVIIFYNFNKELEVLKNAKYEKGTKIAEWNGHCHEPIPKSKRWVYLVQYSSGAEGWNCIETDTIIFFSQNYSYKTMIQAAGRIDRMNTPFTKLYYYHLKCGAGIDYAISKALNEKKKFQESGFYANYSGQT